MNNLISINVISFHLIRATFLYYNFPSSPFHLWSWLLSYNRHRPGSDHNLCPLNKEIKKKKKEKRKKGKKKERVRREIKNTVKRGNRRGHDGQIDKKSDKLKKEGKKIAR